LERAGKREKGPFQEDDHLRTRLLQPRKKGFKKKRVQQKEGDLFEKKQNRKKGKCRMKTKVIKKSSKNLGVGKLDKNAGGGGKGVEIVQKKPEALGKKPERNWRRIPNM